MSFLKAVFRLGLLVAGISLQALHPAVIKEEFVFTQAPFASCHASTLTETSPGHLLCAYFAGTAEGKADVAIWLSSFEKKNWSEPIKVAEVEKNPCWNPVLFTMTTGEVLLFYKGGPNPREWTGFLKRSMTQGKEWSDPEPLPTDILGPVRSKPLLLKNGTLLCGSSTETWKKWECRIDSTQDEGRTWVKGNPINVQISFFGIIQPSFFEGKDGDIKVAMRSHKIGAICLASSHDQGHTWSDAMPTDLPNPNAAVEALTLTDGRTLLVFNDSTTNRYPLSVALSVDGGESWKRALILEDREGEFSYPAAIQTSDGLVHITYTFDRLKIKHVILNPTFLD